MKCQKCGSDNIYGAKFCQSCGNALGAEFTDGVTNRVLGLVRDKMYLAMCILVSAQSFFGLTVGNFNVIAILLTVFMWMVYADGTKNTVDSNKIRNISGTVYAMYIVGIVVSVLMIFAGLLSIGFSGVLTPIIRNLLSKSGIPLFIAGLFSSLTAIIAVFLVVAAVVFAIFSIFGVKSIHGFVKSVYMSCGGAGNRIANVTKARTWLMVFGVLNVISLFCGIRNFSAFLSAGSGAASLIIAGILIKKYFGDLD